jgi:hypothetical protein
MINHYTFGAYTSFEVPTAIKFMEDCDGYRNIREPFGDINLRSLLRTSYERRFNDLRLIEMAINIVRNT